MFNLLFYKTFTTNIYFYILRYIFLMDNSYVERFFFLRCNAIANVLHSCIPFPKQTEKENKIRKIMFLQLLLSRSITRRSF